MKKNNKKQMDMAEIAEHAERLRKYMAASFGLEMTTSRDFRDCSQKIFERAHVNISVSTLKRFWGYVKCSNDYIPSLYTLDVLSKSVGYKNFKCFCQKRAQAQAKVRAHNSIARMRRQLLGLHEELEKLEAIVNLTSH